MTDVLFERTLFPKTILFTHHQHLQNGTAYELNPPRWVDANAHAGNMDLQNEDMRLGLFLFPQARA